MPSFSDEWVNLAAYNLALAEKQGLDIVTLCGSCTRTLKTAQLYLGRDAELKRQVNRRLGELGLTYQGRTKVSHVIQVIDEKQHQLAGEIVNPLDYHVALSHPCNVIRPAEVMKYDDPWKPQKMREIVRLTGASVVDYPLEYECCGATLLMVNREMTLAAAAAKLRSALRAGADLLAVSCGNCQLVLGKLQDEIREADPEIDLPVIFLPQLVGLSMGIKASDLGLENLPAQPLGKK